MLDRAALRRALRGREVVFHTAGFVGSTARTEVWTVNALAPRLAVEAAAAEGVRRVVVTSSVAGIGPAPRRRGRPRGRRLPRRRPRPDLRRLEARGRGRGVRRRRAARRRGRRRQPRLRARRAGRPQPAGRDVDADRRQLPARPAARDRRRRRRTSSTSRTSPPATCWRPSSGEPGERYILGGVQPRLGRADRARRRAVRACATRSSCCRATSARAARARRGRCGCRSSIAPEGDRC